MKTNQNIYKGFKTRDELIIFSEELPKLAGLSSIYEDLKNESD